MDAMRSKLSTLWVFATLNYIYCDVLGVMDPKLLRELLSGNLGTIQMTQGFLFSAGVLVEIPIAMVLAAKFLPGSANRWTNVVAGTVMTVVQGASVFVSVPTAYYVFFSVIEIACTAFIVWLAWRWNVAVAQAAGESTPLRQASESLG